MNITIIYILFVISYAILIYLGSVYLEESNYLRNKGRKKKIDHSKKWFSILIFGFLYGILIYASFYVHYVTLIILLLASTLLFFIAHFIKKNF
ncbi:MAG: hypothetical protein PHY26_04170 [Bacilli bacterium]|nr:hypothetical protein [Bacilli bacterium]